MNGNPSRLAPRFGVMPNFGSGTTTPASSVPVKQFAVLVGQDVTTVLVLNGCRNFPCAWRKYVKRNSFTMVEPSVNVCEAFSCWTVVSLAVPKPGNTLGLNDSKCENGRSSGPVCM